MSDLKKLRILVIGDPHIRNDGFSRIEKMVEEIIRVAEQEKPDLIVDLGDTLHTHNRTTLELQHFAIEFLKKLSRIAPLYVLIGNHDRMNNQDFMSPIHPFEGLESYPNIHIFSKAEVKNFCGFSFFMCPYVFKGRLLEAIGTVFPEEEFVEKIDCCFLHQEIRGSKMETGQISRDGDVWKERYPLAFSGHIHLYGKIAQNAINVGSPIQQRAGDDLNRALSLITLHREKFPSDSERIGKISYTEQRIFLGVPQLISLTLTASEFLKFIVPENAKVILKIVGTPAEIDSLSIVKLNELKDLGVQIHESRITPKRRVNLDTRKDFEVILRESCSPKEKKFLDSLVSSTVSRKRK